MKTDQTKLIPTSDPDMKFCWHIEVVPKYDDNQHLKDVIDKALKKWLKIKELTGPDPTIIVFRTSERPKTSLKEHISTIIDNVDGDSKVYLVGACKKGCKCSKDFKGMISDELKQRVTKTVAITIPCKNLEKLKYEELKKLATQINKDHIPMRGPCWCCRHIVPIAIVCTIILLAAAAGLYFVHSRLKLF